jgi:vitamin B12 transporter
MSGLCFPGEFDRKNKETGAMGFHRAVVGGAALFWPCLFLAGGTNESERAWLNMAEVQVTATRSEYPVMRVPATVDTVSAEAIALEQAGTVDEALRDIPGVNIQGGGFPGEEVSVGMRGMTTGYQSKYVLVLVDGRRMNDAFMGAAEFALLPLDAVEKVEVVKGPTSSLYGSAAIGGAIQVFTEEGGDPFTRFAASGGSYGIQSYRLTHSGAMGAADYFVAMSHVETDGYMNNADGTDRDWRGDNVIGSMSMDAGSDVHLRVQAGCTFGHGKDDNSKRDAQRDFQSVSGTWKPSAGDSETRAIVYRNGSFDLYDWSYPGEGRYRQETLAAEVSHSRKLGESNRVLFGFEARRESVSVRDVTSRIIESAGTGAAYVQDEVSLGRGISLLAGLRQDMGEGQSSATSPRAGLVWAPDESLEIYAAAAAAHRAPPLSDRYVNVVYNGYLFEGNPDLRPEQSFSYELGCRSRPARAVRIAGALFDTRSWDSFDFMLEPDGVFRNSNVNRIRTYGAEFEMRASMPGGFESFVSASYTEGEYESLDADASAEGNRLAYLAGERAAIGLEWSGGKAGRHMLRCRYTGPRYGDAQNTDENRMADFWTVDVRSRVPLSTHADLTLRVNNLFDEKYREFPAFDQPGMIMVAGVEVTF